MGLYVVKYSISYMMQNEDNKARVEEGQSDYDTLISLDWREHLVQVGVQVRKTTHENTYSNQSA